MEHKSKIAAIAKLFTDKELDELRAELDRMANANPEPKGSAKKS